jgi:hypothetical protein
MFVTGAGIPLNTVITAVGASSVTLSQPATASATLSFNFTPATPNPGILQVNSALTLTPSTFLYIDTGNTSGSHPNAFPGIDNDELFVNGNVVLGNAVLVGFPGLGTQVGDTFTIVQASAGNTVSGPGTLSGYAAPIPTPPTATTSAGSPILAVSSTTALSVGMLVSGIGIPSNTFITAVGVSSVTLSQNATASGSPTINFTAPTPITQDGSVFLNGQKYAVHYYSDHVVLTRELATFSTFTLTANPAATVYGQDITVTATYTPEPGASLATANPVITFLVDGFYTVNVPVNQSTGIASFNPQTTLGVVWAAGSMHTISASFSDSNNVFAPATPQPGSVSDTVSENTVTVTANSNPVVSSVAPVYGQTVQVIASLQPGTAPNVPNSSNPTNTVKFVVDSGTPQYIPIDLYMAPPATETATLTILGSNLIPAGPHTVLINYAGTFPAYTGDGNYQASSPISFNLTYQEDGTTITFSPPVTNTPLGQTATISVVVSPNLAGSQGIPHGTVRFYDGSTSNPPIATINNYAGGTASFSSNSLSQGPHTIIAVFTDSDGNYLNSQASTPFTVTKATTATSFVTVVPNNPSYGQSVNITAKVIESPSINPSYGQPSGTIAIWDGPAGTGTLIGTGAVNLSTGQATVATTPTGLAHGFHTLTAVYSGDGVFATSSGTFGLFVAGAQTTTTLAANPSSTQTWNNNVTLTATVNSSVGTPTAGSVTFFDATTGTQLGTPQPINGFGVATLVTNALTAGAHTINAVYSDPSNNFQTSTGTITGYKVTGAPTTVVLVSANPTSGGAVYGQPVMLSATVTSPAVPSGPGPVPVGSVKFVDQATNVTLGTGTIGAGGIASITTTALSQGTHTIVATYTDTVDPYFNSSTGNLTGYQVGTASTGITVASSTAGNVSATGQQVTYTATVVTQPPSNGAAVTTGTVVFKDNGTPIGSAVAVNASGKASVSVTYSAAGSHTITATYTPPGTAPFNYFGSGPASLTQTVIVTAGTTTTMSLSPVFYGNAATLQATVTAPSMPGNPPSSGTVTFKDTFNNVTTVLPGTVVYSSSASGYVATLMTSPTFAIGNHTITASYGGSLPFYGSSAGTGTQVVNKAGTQVTLSPFPTTNYGNKVTLTATVNLTTGGSLSNPTNGVVTFKNGATVLGSVTLNGSNVANFTTTATQLVAGNHTITASYGGTTIFATSTTSSTLAVGQAGTQVTVAASLPTGSQYGQKVTFTAVVSLTTGGSPGTPPGTVTFKDTYNSMTTTLGNGVLKSTTATSATYVFTTTTTQLGVGDHNIGATYNPSNANFATSTGFATSGSNPTVYTVSPAATAITVSSTPGNWALGQTTTFSIAVTSPTGQVPTGPVTVTITDPTSTQVYTTTLTLSGGRASFSYNFPPPDINGNYSVEVDYNSPPANFATSTATVTQYVTNTRISLSASPNPSVQTQPVTFTATVTSAPGYSPPIPGDTVTFYDGTTVLGVVSVDSNGQARLTISTLTVGTHKITVRYNGDSANGLDVVTLSPPLNFVVNPKTGRLV